MGVDLIGIAADIFLGNPVTPIDCHPRALGIKHTGVKGPMFSFKRLLGADPVLGVEMSSTGEVGCLGESPLAAFLQAIIATGGTVVNEKSTVVILAEHTRALNKFIPAGVRLAKHVARILIVVADPTAFSGDELKWATIMSPEDAHAMITKSPKSINLGISFSSTHAVAHGADSSYKTFIRLRRCMVDFAIPTILDVNVATWYSDAIHAGVQHKLKFTTSLQEFHNIQRAAPSTKAILRAGTSQVSWI
jgi:hypothetical protein